MELWILISVLQIFALRKLTVRMHVKPSNGKMDHTDSILASNAMNAIQDQCSKSSPEEQEETLGSSVLLQDQLSRDLMLITFMEFE